MAAATSIRPSAPAASIGFWPLAFFTSGGAWASMSAVATAASLARADGVVHRERPGGEPGHERGVVREHAQVALAARHLEVLHVAFEHRALRCEDAELEGAGHQTLRPSPPSSRRWRSPRRWFRTCRTPA